MRDPNEAAAAADTGPMIRLKDLEKVYPYKGGQTWVLRQVALEIPEADFVTIMGPSGAGKSTLLAILGMLDADFGGEYWFDGKPMHKASSKERGKVGKENIGFVFQQFHLLEDLTVSENLDIPLSYRNVPRKERAARVAEMLDKFQMVGKKDLYPNQLSGGQQQQVADRARSDRGAAHRARRRADRQPALAPRRADHADAHRPERRRHDDHPGLPRRACRRVRPAHHRACGRLDQRRAAHRARRNLIRRGSSAPSAQARRLDARVRSARDTGRVTMRYVPRIFVADDQRDVVESLRLLLKGEGWRRKRSRIPTR